ncbi:MAG TPA: efflux RND transporter periplasmic adaptor subunit [Steroidobacteraceae bacterium]|nr:efflux RND transporter periplasmic adaptor subunit [Steroidobacteraceae bacterium]
MMITSHVLPSFPRRGYFLAALAASLAVGCSQKSASTTPTPRLVGVVTVKEQPVTISTQLPGRTVAYRIAQIRPQVNGVILKRTFVQGSSVKAGEQLYQIDPAPYQAAYDSAEASLMNAQAALELARITVQRYAPLVKTNAISKLTYDTAQATVKQDIASVAAANAAVEAARINLGYTRVVSPITGRSAASLVTEGALVTANQANSLTTVQQLDPIYVDATQPSDTLLRLQREYAAGELQRVGDQQAKVELTLSDGTKFPLAGKLQFADTSVDESTGSVTLQALFPNPMKTLLPGMFVQLRIDEGTRQHAILVPQQGVTHDASGNATALIVDNDNQVKLVTVDADRAIGNDWLVTKGLNLGDRVIVSGVQFVKPGDKVRVEQVRPGTPTEQLAPAGTAGD